MIFYKIMGIALPKAERFSRHLNDVLGCDGELSVDGGFFYKGSDESWAGVWRVYLDNEEMGVYRVMKKPGDGEECSRTYNGKLPLIQGEGLGTKDFHLAFSNISVSYNEDVSRICKTEWQRQDELDFENFP